MVQLYSVLIYGGPGVVSKIHNDLAKLSRCTRSRRPEIDATSTAGETLENRVVRENRPLLDCCCCYDPPVGDVLVEGIRTGVEQFERVVVASNRLIVFRIITLQVAHEVNNHTSCTLCYIIKD